MIQRPSLHILLIAAPLSLLMACGGGDAKPDKPPTEQLDLDGPTAEQLKKTPCANPRWLAPPPGMPQAETSKPAEDTAK